MKFRKLILIKFCITLAALDLLTVLVKGRYLIPFTSIESFHPATSAFILILLLTIHIVCSIHLSKRPWTTRDVNKIVFLTIWLIFLSNFRWRGSGDVVAASLQPFALIRNGNLYLDPYFKNFLDNTISWAYQRNGHILSMYGSAPGLLLTPAYLISAIAGVPVTDLLIHQLQKVGASFMVALSAYFLLVILSLMTKRKWAIGLTFAYALGTSSLSISSQAIWQHGPSQLFLCLGLFFLLKGERMETSDFDINLRHVSWFAYSGFAFALATWCRYSNILVYGVVLTYVLRNDYRRVKSFIVGSLLPAAALLSDNYFHSGHFLKTGYTPKAMEFTSHMSSGFFGLLFSPARGLFLFSPFFIFSLWGFYTAWRRSDLLLDRFLSVAAVLIALFYSSHADWPGGWCFGPRFFSDITPLLVLGIVPIINRLEESFWLRRVFVLTVAYSILAHVTGAYFSWDWETVPQKLWSWSGYPVTYLLVQLVTGTHKDTAEAVVVLIILLGLSCWFLYPMSLALNTSKNKQN